MADPPSPPAPPSHTCAYVTGRADSRGLSRLPASRRGPARTATHDKDDGYDVLCGARAHWAVRDDAGHMHSACDRDLPDVIRMNLGVFGTSLVLNLEHHAS